MKKTRILSMLLSAALAVSSLPMMASAAEPASVPIGQELLTATEDVSKWTSTGAEVTASGATNKYLYVYDRKMNSAGPVLTFGTLQSMMGSAVSADKNYEVVLHINARTQSDVAGDFSWRDTFANTNLSFTAGVNDAWAPLENTAKFVVKGNATIKANLRGAFSYNTLAPVMMDDIALYYRESGSTGNYTCAKLINFEDCNSGTDIATLGFTKNGNEKYAIVEETPHLAVSGTAAGNKDQMTATHSSVYGQKLTLDPGVYELSGDARMMFFYQSSFHNAEHYDAGKGVKVDADTVVTVGQQGWVTGDGGTRDNLPVAGKYYHVLYRVNFHANGAGNDGVNNIQDVNYRNVTLSLVNGSDKIFLDTVRFDETWTHFSTAFEVPAGQTLTIDGIALDGTGKGYDIDPFNVDNLSLKKVFTYKDVTDDATGATVTDIPVNKFSTSGGIALNSNGGFEEGNSFLAYTSRINNNDGIKISINGALPEETTEQYELKFDIRTPVDIKKSDGTVNNQIRLRVYRSDAGLGILSNTTVADITVNNIGQWQTYTIDYDPVAAPNGWIIRGGGGIAFNGTNNSAPFQIDNVRLVKKGTNTVVSGYCDDFEGYSINGDYVYGDNFTYRIARAYNYNALYVPNALNGLFTIDTDEVFASTEHKNASSTTLTYTFPQNTDLEPGYYNIKGQFRNGEYVNAGVLSRDASEKSNYIIACPDPDTVTDGKTPQRILYNNNYINVKANVSLGVELLTSKAVKADENWTDFSFGFRVDETTTVNSIEFLVEHALADSGFSVLGTSVDFKNITLSHYADEASEEVSDAIIFDIAEGNIVSSGSTNVGMNNGFVNGNAFLAFSGRINNNDAIRIAFNGEAPVETATEQYELKFDVRTSVDIYNASGNINNTFMLRAYPSNETGSGFLVNKNYAPTTFSNSDEWHTYTVDYDAAIFPYGILLRGGPGLGFAAHNGAAPYEIDNVRLVLKGTDTVVDGYCDTFDGAEVVNGELYTKPFVYGISHAYAGASNGKNAVLNVETDTAFFNTTFNGTTGTLSYTVADDTVLEPGSYTFTGKFRNAEYINAGVPDNMKLDASHFSTSSGVNYDKPGASVISQYADRAYIVAYPDSGTQGGGNGGTPQLIVNDNNAFNIIASVVTETDGNARTRTSDAVRVDSGWTEFNYTIILKEATELKSIDFNLIHALDGSPLNVAATTVDFKDLEIKYFPEKDRNGGIPNLGIVMMLMAKRGDSTANLPTADMTAKIADGTTTLGEAVTTFDAANFAKGITVVDNKDNTYLTMTSRINNGDGITVKNAGLNLDSAKSYEIKFDIRASVDVEKIAAYDEGLSYVRVWYGANSKTGVELVYNDSQWTTVTVPYVADQVTAGLHFVGGIGATYSYPFDIDNVRIVEAGTDNVVVSVDFEDMDAAVIAEGSVISKNGLEFSAKYMYADAVNGKDAKIAVEDEDSFARATVDSTAKKLGTVNYNAAATLEPGTYTVTAMVRNGYYNGSNNDISVNTAPNYILREPDNNTTNTRQRITENNNYVNVVGQVVTGNLVYTSKATPVKVYAEWTPVEFTFTAAEAVSVEQIRIGGTHALLDTDLAVSTVTLDVKDVAIYKAN